MIIDVHNHLYPPEIQKNQEAISLREPYFDKLTHNKVHKWGTAEELIERMDADGVDQCWCFGFAFADLGLCQVCNDYLAWAAQQWPDRIKPFAVLPPRHPRIADELVRVKKMGFIGVGELFPQGQDFDLTNLSHTTPLVEACQELGLIINTHTAEPVGHDYAGKGDVGPKEAYAFCSHHPEVKVIFAHFGGGLWLYETMPEVREVLKNAAYDTAAWVYLYGAEHMKAAFAAGVGHKMLFGTDWPLLTNKRFQSRIDGAGLTEEQKSDLMGLNAQRFAS